MTRIVKMKFRPDMVSTFEKVFWSSKLFIEQMPGCEGVTLHRDRSDHCTMFTISEWKSEEHLNEYRSSEFFRATWLKTKELFDAKPEAWSLDNITNNNN